MAQNGIIDPEYAVREGWVRDEDSEISMDGYNAFIQILTDDGTSGFSVKNSSGAVAFSVKSDGDGYISRNLGVGTSAPEEKLDVRGVIKTQGFSMPTGAQNNYVLTSNASGSGTWQDPGAATLPTPTCCGQVLFAATDGAFTPELPLTSYGGWMVNNAGTLLIVG